MKVVLCLLILVVIGVLWTLFWPLAVVTGTIAMVVGLARGFASKGD